MFLTREELIRTLEYIPKDTAPDLHEKFLGALVSRRYYEELWGAKRRERADKQDAFISGLTEGEMEAWQAYSESIRVREEPCLTFKEEK